MKQKKTKTLGDPDSTGGRRDLLTPEEIFERIDQQEYSTDELMDLLEIKEHLEHQTQWPFSYDTAKLREMFGPIVDMPIFPLLAKAKAASLFCDPSLFADVGRKVTMAIIQGDDDFFHQLECFVKADRGNKNLSKILSKDFGWTFPRGQRKKPHNLSYVFPQALIEAINLRFIGEYKDDAYKGNKITRDELKEATKLLTSSAISNFELSRQLKKYDFNRFMAEQPIMQKKAK